MRLEEAAVDRYGPLRDWRPTCRAGLTVYAGPNEAGKTLYLEALMRLLDPDVTAVLDPPPVTGEPTGRVVVELGGDYHELGDGRSLGDVSPITPHDLQTVFVVRDVDLALPEGVDYYTELIERLGDSHASAIDELTDELRDIGRLTDALLKVSDTYNDAKTVRDDATTLAEEIEAYLAEVVEPEGLDDLHGRRLGVERERRSLAEALERQRLAGRVARHDRLSGRLETYERTSRRLDELAAFHRDTLEDLREFERERTRLEGDLEATQAELSAASEEREAVDERLAATRRKVASLQRREGAVETADEALQSHREAADRVADVAGRTTLGRWIGAAGLLGAGLAAAVGASVGSTPALAIAAGLLVVGLVGAAVAWLGHRRRAGVERAQSEAIRAGRDAGFAVESVEELAPAIEGYREDRASLEQRVIQLERDRENLDDRIASLEDEVETMTADMSEAGERLVTTLEAAGVEDIATFADRAEEREATERERERAATSLRDAVGEPEASDWLTRVDAWAEDLAELVADVDTDTVDPDAHDPDELDRLESELDGLREERDDLEARLEAYDARLDGFQQRARSLDAKPFVGEAVELAARSRDGLERLARDLRELAATIDGRAETARNAIHVFQDLRRDEREKLTNLFAPDGPTSRTFARITDGRYTSVGYDAEGASLEVTREDGQTFAPAQLSRGTCDQLYLASRISLADRLLRGEPGFLLLDDPLVGADPQRLAGAFEALCRLADDGWQILYFTAKAEVYTDAVAEHDVVCETLAERRL